MDRSSSVCNQRQTLVGFSHSTLRTRRRRERFARTGSSSCARSPTCTTFLATPHLVWRSQPLPLMKTEAMWRSQPARPALASLGQQLIFLTTHHRCADLDCLPRCESLLARSPYQFGAAILSGHVQLRGGRHLSAVCTPTEAACEQDLIHINTAATHAQLVGSIP